MLRVLGYVAVKMPTYFLERAREMLPALREALREKGLEVAEAAILEKIQESLEAQKILDLWCMKIVGKVEGSLVRCGEPAVGWMNMYRSSKRGRGKTWRYGFCEEHRPGLEGGKGKGNAFP